MTWFEAPSGATSLSTPTSVASFDVSSAQMFATIGPVSCVSRSSGGVV